MAFWYIWVFGHVCMIYKIYSMEVVIGGEIIRAMEAMLCRETTYQL